MGARLLAGAAAAVLLWSAVAGAHAVLMSATPAAGDVVTEPPQTVVFEFNEPVASVRVVVADPGGAPIMAGSPVVEGTRVAQPLAPISVPGGYSVAYRVTSADGHPIEGEYTFTYDPPPDADPATGEPADPPGADDPADDEPAPLADQQQPGDPTRAFPLRPLLLAVLAAAAVLSLVVFARRNSIAREGTSDDR